MITSKQLVRYVYITTAALLITLLGFELTSTDLWVQQWLFDSVQQSWLWQKSEPVARFLFYDGIKALIILSAVFMLVSLIFLRGCQRVKGRVQALRIVILSLMVVPAVVGTLKGMTNVACPSQLDVFDGNLPYVTIFRRYPQGGIPEKRGRCFPAGHASAGFSLLSLYFLFRSKRKRQTALAFALTLGWVMGVYKMVIGDHFLSHTIVSMELAWLLTCLVALSDKLILEKLRALKPSASPGLSYARSIESASVFPGT